MSDSDRPTLYYLVTNGTEFQIWPAKDIHVEALLNWKRGFKIVSAHKTLDEAKAARVASQQQGDSK